MISFNHLPALARQPLVSVIVPSFNQGRFIRTTIDSILAQDYRPIEILVIDGASTDETLEVLTSFGNVPELEWISEPDRGVVEAVNKGFARARGQIAAIQSSDDYYLPGAIRGAVDVMVKDPQVGLVYGGVIKVDQYGAELMRSGLEPFSLENLLTRRTNVLQPSAFFRLDLARALGGWDERYFNADTHLWYRMAFRTKVRKLDGFQSKRTMHSEQRDTNGAKIIQSNFRMVDELEELRSAPSHLRRAARCGKYLHAIRYGGDLSSFRRKYLLWRAIFSYPEILALPAYRCAAVPGLSTVRGLLGKLRRRFSRRGS